MRHRRQGKNLARNVLERRGKQCIHPLHSVGRKQAQLHTQTNMKDKLQSGTWKKIYFNKDRRVPDRAQTKQVKEHI